MYYQCLLCYENLPKIASTSKNPPKLQYYFDLQDLIAHVCRHYNFKPFCCKFCNISFFMAKDIIQHYHLAHQKSCLYPNVS